MSDFDNFVSIKAELNVVLLYDFQIIFYDKHISYKTIFSKYYLEVNSYPISIIILSTKAERCVCARAKKMVEI
jgi:hypothetical protein